MRVLGIGYGRNLFNKGDFEHQRLNRCAQEVDSYDHIVFSDKSDDLKTLTTEQNFTLHPTSSLNKLTMVFDAMRIGNKILKQKQIDIVSAQDLFATGLVGLWLKWRHPEVALQVQEHGDVMASKHWRREKLINRFWYRFAFVVLRRADIIRVVSDRTKTFLERELGTGKTIKKLPVVIDTSSFVSGVDNTNVDDDVFTFVTFARFVPQKNFPLMLSAFAKAYEVNPKIRLRIFGSGPLEKDIINQIKSLNLMEVVELNGWTNDVAGEMSKASAYLLTSNYEGWARVLIEAVLQKLPLVTTDVGCVNEVVKDQAHGLVVPVDDLGNMSDAIVRLSTDAGFYCSVKDNLQNLKLENIPGTNIDEYAGLWVETLN